MNLLPLNDKLLDILFRIRLFCETAETAADLTLLDINLQTKDEHIFSNLLFM